MNNFLVQKRQHLTIAIASAASILLVVGITYSATTISTNVNTGGSLTVSGASTLTGAVTMSSTLDVTGLTTLVNASTTQASVSNALWVGGNATTTASNGYFATQGFIGAGGTSTPVAELSALGTATTTMYLHSSGTKKGSCIELVRSHDGGVFRISVGTTTLNNYDTTVLQVESGSCK